MRQHHPNRALDGRRIVAPWVERISRQQGRLPEEARRSPTPERLRRVHEEWTTEVDRPGGARRRCLVTPIRSTLGRLGSRLGDQV